MIEHVLLVHHVPDYVLQFNRFKFLINPDKNIFLLCFPCRCIKSNFKVQIVNILLRRPGKRNALAESSY